MKLPTAIQSRLRTDAPPGVPAPFVFEAPAGRAYPYIVLLPLPGSTDDDTADRTVYETWQVSVYAKSAVEACSVRDAFTDWLEKVGAWESVAPDLVVVLAPKNPQQMRAPSGAYHATADITASFSRPRPA
ncbi:MAG: hypothetical protein JSS51_04430 [Planctomycetes bacterium]|nr:hypothetical protein [Planctomycetota bacterium]